LVVKGSPAWAVPRQHTHRKELAMMSQNPLDYAEVTEVDADEIQGALAALDELDAERDRRRERHLSARLLVRVARALDLDPARIDPRAVSDLDPEAVAESVAEAVARAQARAYVAEAVAQVVAPA